MKTIKIKFLIMQIRIAAFILFLSLAVFVNAKEKADTVKFVHITDVHICNLASYHPLFKERRQHYGEGVDPFRSFLKKVPGKTRSDFVIITGDMIDYYEAETPSGELLDTQVEQFVRHLDVSSVPVYMTLGNHDIASYPEAKSGSHQYNAGEARAAWIRNAPCFRNGTYYSRTFKVDTTTYRLIFLDNGYYSPNRSDEGASQYIIDRYQLLWLDDQLKKSDNDIEIILMHIPLFEPAPEDLSSTRNKYFLDLEDTVSVNHTLNMPDKDSFDLFSVLEENSSARLILSGHKHSSVIHDVHFSNDYSLTHVMTGAFARDSRNWRLIQLTGESIIVSYSGDKRKQHIIFH